VWPPSFGPDYAVQLLCSIGETVICIWTGVDYITAMKSEALFIYNLEEGYTSYSSSWLAVIVREGHGDMLFRRHTKALF